jgi:hypothetical protein
MAVQGGFQRETHRCLWQGHHRCVRLCWRRWHRSLAGWFGLAVGVSHRGVDQCLGSPGTGGTEAVTVDARVAPHTSAAKPCVHVSAHTAPQLLSPCHGRMQCLPCLVNPLLQQQQTICFFSSLPPCGAAFSMRLWPSFAPGCFPFPLTVFTSAYPLAFPEALAP